MAERVELDPDGYRKGVRAMGAAHDSAQAWGERVASILSRLPGALGSDGYATKALEDEGMREFSENVAEGSSRSLPGGAGEVHRGMVAGLEAFEAADNGSARNFT